MVNCQTHDMRLFSAFDRRNSGKGVERSNVPVLFALFSGKIHFLWVNHIE